MIDNLRGLVVLYAKLRWTASAEQITDCAQRLCRADMGAAAVHRHMHQAYHDTVAEARRWLRDHPALA